MVRPPMTIVKVEASQVSACGSPHILGRPTAVVSNRPGYVEPSPVLDGNATQEEALGKAALSDRSVPVLLDGGSTLSAAEERNATQHPGSHVDDALGKNRERFVPEAVAAGFIVVDQAEQPEKADHCSATVAVLHGELQVERSKREQAEEECRAQSEVCQSRLVIGEQQMDLLAAKLKKAHDAFEEQFLDEASRRTSAEERAVELEQRLASAEESAGQTAILTQECEGLRQQLLEERSRRPETQGMPEDVEKQLQIASMSVQGLAAKEVIGQHAEQLIQDLERKLADVEFGELSLARRQVDMEAFIAQQSKENEESTLEQLGALRQRLAGAERDAAAEIAAESWQATAAVKAATVMATVARAEASEEQEASARLRGQLAARQITHTINDENEAWLQESLVSETMLRQQAEAQVCILQQQLSALQQALSSLVLVHTGTIGDEHNVQRLQKQLHARDVQRQQMEARLASLQQQLSAAERTAKEFMEVLDKVSEELSSEEIRREQVAEQALLLRRQVAVMRPQIRQVRDAATPQAWTPLGTVAVQYAVPSAPASASVDVSSANGVVNTGVRGGSIERFVSVGAVPSAVRASSVERDGPAQSMRMLPVSRIRKPAVPSAAVGPLLPRFGHGSREASPLAGIGHHGVAPREEGGATTATSAQSGMATPPFSLNPYNPRAAVRAPVVRAPQAGPSPPTPVASPVVTPASGPNAVTAPGRRSPPAPSTPPLVAATVPTPRPARAPRAGSCSPTSPGMPAALLPTRGPRSRSPVATAAVITTPAVAPSPPTPMSVHPVSQVYRHVSAR